MKKIFHGKTGNGSKVQVICDMFPKEVHATVALESNFEELDNFSITYNECDIADDISLEDYIFSYLVKQEY